MTNCPNCEATDSLEQGVTVSTQTTRTVQIVTGKGKPKIEYGIPEEGAGYGDVEDEQNIVCRRCKQEFTEEQLLQEEDPEEHRCTGCDWWGWVPWQHAIEHPDCSGTVHKLSESVEVAA